MNQRDLRNIIQKEHALPSRESSSVLLTILGTIKKELRAGRKVRLRNFGSFSTKHYAEKIYQDVKTRKIKILPARTKVKYSPSKNILGASYAAPKTKKHSPPARSPQQ